MINNTGLHPYGYYILVEIGKIEKKSNGGIFLTENTIAHNLNAVNWGKIIETGPHAFEEFKEKDKLSIGKYIYFKKYSGIGKNINGIEYRIIADEDVVGWSDSPIKNDDDLIGK